MSNFEKMLNEAQNKDILEKYNAAFESVHKQMSAQQKRKFSMGAMKMIMCGAGTAMGLATLGFGASAAVEGLQVAIHAIEGEWAKGASAVEAVQTARNHLTGALAYGGTAGVAAVISKYFYDQSKELDGPSRDNKELNSIYGAMKATGLAGMFDRGERVPPEVYAKALEQTVGVLATREGGLEGLEDMGTALVQKQQLNKTQKLGM